MLIRPDDFHSYTIQTIPRDARATPPFRAGRFDVSSVSLSSTRLDASRAAKGPRRGRARYVHESHISCRSRRSAVLGRWTASTWRSAYTAASSPYAMVVLARRSYLFSAARPCGRSRGAHPGRKRRRSSWQWAAGTPRSASTASMASRWGQRPAPLSSFLGSFFSLPSLFSLALAFSLGSRICEALRAFENGRGGTRGSLLSVVGTRY